MTRDEEKGKAWKVVVSRDAGADPKKWRAWIDFRTGWCATTVYPHDTKQEAQACARRYRLSLRLVERAAKSRKARP